LSDNHFVGGTIILRQVVVLIDVCALNCLSEISCEQPGIGHRGAIVGQSFYTTPFFPFLIIDI